MKVHRAQMLFCDAGVMKLGVGHAMFILPALCFSINYRIKEVMSGK